MSKEIDTPHGIKKTNTKDNFGHTNIITENGENLVVHKERRKFPRCPPMVLHWINKLLENNFYIIFMTIVTLYALFGDDFRLLLSPKSGDPVFWSLT